MLNWILSDLAEFFASILMFMKHLSIYFWPYFGNLLRQEISPYIQQSLCWIISIYYYLAFYFIRQTVRYHHEHLSTHSDTQHKYIFAYLKKYPITFTFKMDKVKTRSQWWYIIHRSFTTSRITHDEYNFGHSSNNIPGI